VKTGTIKVLLKGPEVHMLVNVKGSSGAQIYALDGHDARVYNPVANIVDVYDLASRQTLVNQFLLLGFGTTSAQLKSGYDVTYVGDEKMGDQPTSHVRLVPKSAETRHNLKQAELWYAGNGLVVQQKLLYPDGNFLQMTYSNMKQGLIQEKDLELKQKGATVTKH
jgi:negative regulator of sigma E activity